MKKRLILASILVFAGCSGARVASEQAPQDRPGRAVLSREEASERFKQVGRIAYTLWFGLDSTREDFDGRAVITFDLRPQAPGKTLSVDFENGSLKSLSLNGAPSLDEEQLKRKYDGKRITFDLSELRSGQNRLEIAFTARYSKNGNGLYRFQDPADQRIYVYSNFEPYSAHRMFPCFDQPDLKGSFELTVDAPENWEVVSNTLERDVTEIQGRKTWQFPPSPLLSTYIFALHAGPYAVWRSDAEGIPLRLFARQSLKQYVDAPEWFEVTSKGLDYFAVQFGYPYPYAKYDQLIVPDFNSGAMENAAAITFSERYVYRTRVTRDQHRRRADTILHEMAHMWFGDLVTMKWWNGLWLNESFATFSAAQAVDRATSFGDPWLAFFVGNKQWAYWEDQLSTTHPIEVPVPDTETAESIFDGITYGKGASVLKQLAYSLGEEDYREGLQRYFQKYALRNTTLNDFVRMLSEAAGKDLSPWQKSWLTTHGVNTLRADWTCDDQGKVKSFKLVQGLGNSPELRTHRTRIALISGGGKKREEIDASYSGAETPVSEAVGKRCPEFVFPNSGDFDYAKIEFDALSLKFAATNLAKISDPLTRAMIWHTLWEMVTDGLLRPQDFADTVLAQSGAETDTQILSRVLRNLVSPSATRASVLKMLPANIRSEYAPRIEKHLQKKLEHARGGSDAQLVYFAAYLDSATQHSTEYLLKLLHGKAALVGLKLDQEKRWDLVKALSRIGVPDAPALIAAESKRDATDMGTKAAIAAEAQIPDAVAKTKWLREATQVGSARLPIGKLREAMSNYQIVGQEQFTHVSVDAYFSTIESLADEKDEEYAGRFAAAFFPSLCDPKIVERSTRAIDAGSKLPAEVLRKLKANRQEEERCIRARAKALEKLPGETNPG